MPDRGNMRLDAPKALDWRQIEQDARTQALEAEGRPLGLGQSVAWVERRFGRTNGLGAVHRADEHQPGAEEQKTLCGDRVPPVILHVALTPNLVRTLGRCRYCDAEYLKLAERGKDAA